MTKQNSIKRSGGKTVLVLIFILTALAVECPAAFYRPATAVSIASEYTALNDSSPPHSQVWKVIPEAAPDGSVALRFFMEAAAGADAVCELYFPPAGADGLIRWQGIGKNTEKTSDTGLLLAPGFPAPCDVIPVGGEVEGRLYQETSRAGGSVFTRTYRVSVDTLSVDEARAKGWIREGQPKDSEDLVMVTVTDDRGKLTVRQLWPVDGSWWIYEETPQRRSWLLY